MPSPFHSSRVFHQDDKVHIDDNQNCLERPRKSTILWQVDVRHSAGEIEKS
jgi:hypothetical protein